MNDVNPDWKQAAREMAGSCYALRLRMSSRVVTGIYEEAMRGRGVTAAQLNLLAAIGSTPGVRPTDLGTTLKLDPSTLSRNLKRMREREWIDERIGEDARNSHLYLSDGGKRSLSELYGSWRAAQLRVEELLGELAASVPELADVLAGSGGFPRSG